MSAKDIGKVAVIGAGTMGTGIAAQAANAGCDVVLLDVKGGPDAPNAAAERGRERIGKSDPPLLMAPETLERIRTGNVSDDLAMLADCDWICEAVVEQLPVKQRLYRDLVLHLKPGALVSSNTSTIPIALLMEGMPETLRKRFCITHFFNPVRYMRLLELVGDENTPVEVLERLSEFCDVRLGKGIVRCADTPGFLANRVGVYALQAAVHEATQLGLAPDQADALFGRPMGIPKTGAFGLYDLIGLDLMADVVRSLRSILPEDDPFHEVGAESDLINGLVEKGFTGRKGKGGFYARIDGDRVQVDLSTGEWRPMSAKPPEIAGRAERDGVAVFLEGDEPAAVFARRVLLRVLSYSASLIPSVTHSPQDVDDAMKLGYNWIRGPFELIDEIGAMRVAARLEAEGLPVPEFLSALGDKPVYRVANGELQLRHWDGNYHPVDLPPGVARFHMLRRTLIPVEANESASLFHLDDGIRLVEFHTKANALDAGSVRIMAAAAADPGPGIVIHNDGQQFSAGVNLQRFLDFIDAGDWAGIDGFLLEFQETMAALRDCPVPVVGTPFGLALGGGYEVLAHCDSVVAHANTVMGLVEPLVGLVPGGGGVKESYVRWHARSGDWEQAAWKTLEQISAGVTASSPQLAADLAYFEPGRDRQVMNRDRLLGAARERIGELSRGYEAPKSPEIVLAGGESFERLRDQLEADQRSGKLTEHDLTVATALAGIVTGGKDARAAEVSETEMFAREREAFLSLARTPETRARIVGLLAKGQPARN